MTSSQAQRNFNPYPVRDFKPDIWHGLSKAEKRDNLKALIYSHLIDGGKVTKIAPKKSRDKGRPQIFCGDTKQSTSYEIGVRKFYAGDDFTYKGKRFTAKQISETSRAQRSTEQVAGTGHEKFSGAVISIEGKLAPRHDNSVKRDALDTFSDAIRTAAIDVAEDEIDLDTEHAEHFKLAA